LLAASDVFVLSSDREGLPIAALEALAAGRPVVATAVGDVPTVVRDGVTGKLVPPRDPAALASALVELLGDPERRRHLGANGRRLVAGEFSVQAMMERYDALYRG
jgi:glycosyltransferase involved in cell wall biosynthesis